MALRDWLPFSQAGAYFQREKYVAGQKEISFKAKVWLDVWCVE